MSIFLLHTISSKTQDILKIQEPWMFASFNIQSVVEARNEEML
jgi:hypothetical protein